MSNPIFNWIKSLKQLRFAPLAIASAASFLLLFTTACNPSSPSVSGTGSYTEGRAPQTELYRPIQPKEGGPNTYSDTDPRRDTSAASAKTKRLIDNAERNLNKVQSPRELADEVKAARPLKEGTQKISDRVGNTVEELTEDISQGTKRGIKNLERNTTRAQEGVQDTLDDARQNVDAAGKQAARTAGRTADQLKNNVDTARQEVTDKVGSSLNRAGNSANDGLGTLRSEAQRTPDLDTSDLIERAKNTFGTATRNVQ
ncbi:MAG: hypothetical protein MUF72_16535 [Elainella sp. Prado103]|nr:hypothetical protein [Elainella sp. Prado103]